MNYKVIIILNFTLGMAFLSCQPSIDVMLDKALILAKEKKCNDAINVYNEIIRRNSKIQLPYYNRGHCYLSLKNYQKALADFNKVMDLQRQGDLITTFNKDGLDQSIEVRGQVPYFEALYLRAQVKYYMDSIKSSFSDFQSCIDENYEQSSCTVWQGMLWIGNGRKDKACDWFSKAMELAATEDDKKEARQMLSTYCNQ